MTRTRAVAAAAALVLAAGCSSEGSSPDGSPDPEPSRTPTSSTSAPTTDPAKPAVVLRGYPGSSCQTRGGMVVEVGSMRVTRPVTLEKAGLVGDVNVVHGAPSVVARPDRGPDWSGSYPGPQPSPRSRRDLGWDQRKPLAGAQLEPGRYYFFLPLRVRPPSAHFDALQVTWSEGDVPGVDEAERVSDFKDSCR
ncbi:MULTISPECIES: hypothetical protein [unclassified Nocardioides]|uniref:hypothetical protein n=1 Tax=unclassified Nocardioides TaxID=2615069 RepID=UPI0009F0C1FC|nr:MULTISPECIES: hypothetical protein [unclassified Nocardioides]GAW50817.1 hypothetical protein PD653B2_3153 [Nocardioides sp. PD653-B2]GAW52756.1 hypothetical protein PD653_0149 [Nocardioides sp. PD653]